MQQLIVALAVIALSACSGMDPDGGEARALLASTIAYHDPEGIWERSRHQLSVREQRENADGRETYLVIDNPTGRFQMLVSQDGNAMRATIDGSLCTASVNASTEFPQEVEDRYGLSCNGIAAWQRYYRFLFGLPMNLDEQGVRLSSEIGETVFEGTPVHVLTVTYNQQEGKDVWHLYIDRETNALIGCRFVYDVAQLEGEYIVFEGEVESNGVRLPRVRKWYNNEDGAYIGQDIIESYRYDDGLGG
jgi:hypothetical protein